MSGLDFARTCFGDLGDLGVDRDRGRLVDRSGGPGDGRGEHDGAGLGEDEVALIETERGWWAGWCGG